VWTLTVTGRNLGIRNENGIESFDLESMIQHEKIKETRSGEWSATEGMK
jgi:hypothetical protein